MSTCDVISRPRPVSMVWIWSLFVVASMKMKVCHDFWTAFFLHFLSFFLSFCFSFSVFFLAIHPLTMFPCCDFWQFLTVLAVKIKKCLPSSQSFLGPSFIVLHHLCPKSVSMVHEFGRLFDVLTVKIKMSCCHRSFSFFLFFFFFSLSLSFSSPCPYFLHSFLWFLQLIHDRMCHSSVWSQQGEIL